MKRYYTPLLLALAAFALLVAGCSQNTAKPAQAQKPKSAPERIVSLTPSNTEILFALGLGQRVVGVTKYCNYPPEAKSKAKIGDMNVSIERVVGLKPDLVLAHSTLNDTVIKRLESLKIPVLATDPKTFAEVMSSIKETGEATGANLQAEMLVSSMQETIDKVQKSTGKQKNKVLVVIQSSPLWAAGPETFVDEMIKYSGGENIAHDGKPGFNTFSNETAVARNPDVIIVTIKADKAYFERTSAWKNTNAVRNKRVVVIDPDIIVRPSPRLAQGLEELSKAVRGR